MQKQEINVQKNVMQVQSCVLLIRPVVFLTFSLLSASLDLKVPNIKMKRLGFTSDEVARGVQSHAQTNRSGKNQNVSEAPNDGFLPHTLKTLFRLF